MLYFVYKAFSTSVVGSGTDMVVSAATVSHALRGRFYSIVSLTTSEFVQGLTGFVRLELANNAIHGTGSRLADTCYTRQSVISLSLSTKIPYYR